MEAGADLRGQELLGHAVLQHPGLHPGLPGACARSTSRRTPGPDDRPPGRPWACTAPVPPFCCFGAAPRSGAPAAARGQDPSHLATHPHCRCGKCAPDTRWNWSSARLGIATAPKRPLPLPPRLSSVGGRAAACTCFPQGLKPDQTYVITLGSGARPGGQCSAQSFTLAFATGARSTRAASRPGSTAPARRQRPCVAYENRAPRAC